MYSSKSLKSYVSVGILSIVLAGNVYADSIEDDGFVIMPRASEITKNKKIIGLTSEIAEKVTGSGVKVAIIDGAYDFRSDTESALSQSCIELAPQPTLPEYILRNASLYHYQYNDHANHVASIIGGKNGISPGATIRTIDYTNDPAVKGQVSYGGAIAASIDQAIKSKAKFINISLRLINTKDGWISNEIRKAFHRARDAGIGIIKSAGNDREVIGQTIYTTSLAYLANEMKGSLIFAVNLNNEDLISDSSNTAGIAKSFTLSAPGTDILACGANERELSLTGTSMAAPHITAAATLIQSAFPTLTAQQCFDILTRSARKQSTEGTPLRSEHYGQGVINVKAALDLAAREMKQEIQDSQRIFKPLPPKPMFSDLAQEAAKSAFAKGVSLAKKVGTSLLSAATTVASCALSAAKSFSSWLGY